MPSCIHFKTFVSMLVLVIVGITDNAFSASSDQSKLEKLVIPLSNTPEFTFTMPTKSKINLFLMTNKSTETTTNSIGQITITDQGCTLGHQVSITYERTRDELLTTYFPKEVPWDTTYKLSVSQDAKTNAFTVTLNNEILSVTPYKKAKFIYLINDPAAINIINIEQH